MPRRFGLDAAYSNCHDFASTGSDTLLHQLKVAILSGARHQPRVEGLSGDDQGAIAR